MKLNKEIESIAKELVTEFDKIPENRRELLSVLTAYIREKKDAGTPIQINYICTHNSRRSHIAQCWGAAAAVFYDFDNVESFSGGTSATALNAHAKQALSSCGFSFTEVSGGSNPHYEVTYSPEKEPLIAFSKFFSDAPNPSADFAAVMVCSDADQNCPFVPGASKRIKLTYNDPKESDGTGREEEVYLQRVKEIGREILFAFSMV